MALDKECIASYFSLKDCFSNLSFRVKFSQLHPDYFYPSGLILFTGAQGHGKTLSAVRYLDNLCKKYPKAKIISNISLSLPHYKNEYYPYDDIEKIDIYDNGEYGLILFIDEIQVEFASMESRNLPPSILQKISQQRKRRLHIVGTTQLFGRVAKPFREQCNSVIDCSSYFNLIQINSVIDFSSVTEDINGNLKDYKYSGRYFWFRGSRFFDYYDTFNLVKRSRK